jgi:hypothetical protein
MATSLSLENDSSLAQGYIKVNGTTAATLTTSGITGNLTGNVTGNADTATKLSTTTGSAPAYACRAWVNFDGTRDTTGAVSTANTNRFIRASGNVTSVLRNGLGDYTITFTTAMSDANYSWSVSGHRGDGSGAAGFCAQGTTSNAYTSATINSLRVVSVNFSNQTIDCPAITVQIFGN